MVKQASLFSQVLCLVDRHHFEREVRRWEAERHAKGFSCNPFNRIFAFRGSFKLGHASVIFLIPSPELSFANRPLRGPKKGSGINSRQSHLIESHAVDAVLPGQVPTGKEKFET
jgi:hypothetical protein